MMIQRVLRRWSGLVAPATQATFGYRILCKTCPSRSSAWRWVSSSVENEDNQIISQGNKTQITVTKSKRRRFRRLDNVPSYKDFLHKQAVLNLYRQFLRTVKHLTDAVELRQQIRKEFNATSHEMDTWNKKRALQEGHRRLKDLQATVVTSSIAFGASAATQHSTDEEPRVGAGWPWERSL